jgi:hypothetical protein
MKMIRYSTFYCFLKRKDRNIGPAGPKKWEKIGNNVSSEDVHIGSIK